MGSLSSFAAQKEPLTMTSAALSIKVFGVYAILTGLNLMIAPNLMLSALGIQPTNEIWLRVVGVLGFVVGYYYWACGVANAKDFFKATLIGRSFGFFLPIVLIFAAGAPWQLALFGLIDIIGAAWTAAALKAERNGGGV